ncbi:MAG: hypothetical protein J6Q22_03050 [Prevotella sp.]|nr:hypothetical protein [Prevotella sp.]
MVASISQLVLYTLGVEEYGIYNVVGGIVPMFAFINGSMVTYMQRYLTSGPTIGNQESLSLNP